MAELQEETAQTKDSYVSMALGLAVILVVGLVAFNYFSGKSQEAEKKKQEAMEEEMVELPTTHTVAEGDTLWSISEKYYKTGYNWQDIQLANEIVYSDYVQAGQTITIPDVEPIFPEGDVSGTATEKKTYTVMQGDSLWTIAQNYYGSGFRWVDIAQANNLTNPDLIHAGNILTLP